MAQAKAAAVNPVDCFMASSPVHDFCGCDEQQNMWQRLDEQPHGVCRIETAGKNKWRGFYLMLSEHLAALRQLIEGQPWLLFCVCTSSDSGLSFRDSN
jgi:hypothetical protein